MKMNTEAIKERLLFEGADGVYFGYLGPFLSGDIAKLPFSISILVRLSEYVADTLKDGPTKIYFHNYRSINAMLDRMSLLAQGMIQKQGYRAVAVPASQTDDSEAIKGFISHKMAAVHADAGYIGRNALFISDEFGSAVRLATVLTDMPVAEKKIVHRKSECGSCDLCVRACPSGAITGAEYEEGAPRESVFLADVCSAYMKKAYQHIGRGAVCGICIGVCPKRYKGTKEG
ncbi:MAG: epoxyqueuosine reductase [Christensenellaceae bacterium]|nr:epoxyqueuosine reductase [Christensenellaceae bacterium]